MKIVKYTGQQNVALIQKESDLKNDTYQKQFDTGVAICKLDDYLKYRNRK